MTLARQDKFLENLQNLQKSYPEYSPILQLLIEQIQKGKATSIQTKLQQLRDEDW